MDRNEYESRIRALDERLGSSIEVLRAAHRVERRALDFLWMTSPGNVGASAAAGDLPLGAPTQAPHLAPAKARAPQRWFSVDLVERVSELVEELPEVFDREDIMERLKDHPPERSMLYRALEELRMEEVIAIVKSGGGRVPTQFRRAAKSSPATEAPP
jgi:hypothetical protein